MKKLKKANYKTKTPILEVREHIRKYFRYDSDTGSITRSDRKNINGSYDAYGYLIMKVKGVQIKAHRLAWFLEYGYFPEKHIDHIDMDKKNNRIKNLREATHLINVENRIIEPNRDTGYVGIHKDKSTKGLKSVYTTKIDGKSHRFRHLNEAVRFRADNNKQV